MREIEVKAVLKDKESFLRNAAERGIIFGDPIIQEDTTYETTIPYDDPLWNIFRIRKQGGEVILTMKYKASIRSRDNHERETVIEDADQVADMLERVGYSLGVRIRKSRQLAHYEGLELCLDEIDGLGSFVEVEKLTEEDADVDAIQSHLWKLLLDLGIGLGDRTHKGYDTMMHELMKSK
jgi:adenylate cyclase class 2